jgi:glutamyl-tRNA synthetase
MDDKTQIEDVVNKESKFETSVLTEVCLSEIKKGEVIQLERRGYFFVDKVADEHGGVNLHFLPDGRSKNISVIKTKIDVKSLSKGEEKTDKKPENNRKILEREKKKEAKAEKKAEKKAKKEDHKKEGNTEEVSVNQSEAENK